jgi:hypothetical protein
MSEDATVSPLDWLGHFCPGGILRAPETALSAYGSRFPSRCDGLAGRMLLERPLQNRKD